MASWESVWRPAAGAAGVGEPTFAVVGEMEQKGLQAAGVWSELVPHDFAEEDDGDIVLHLKTTDLGERVSMVTDAANTSGKMLPSQVSVAGSWVSMNYFPSNKEAVC